VSAAELLRRAPTPLGLIADHSYDARKLREWLTEPGCEPVIPSNPTRKHPATYDPVAHRTRKPHRRHVLPPQRFPKDRNALRQALDIYLLSILWPPLSPGGSIESLEGQYEYAYGPYPFDSASPQAPTTDDKFRAIIATHRLDFVLFRVASARFAALPFKLPFVTNDYGLDRVCQPASCPTVLLVVARRGSTGPA